jgi:hypothetical protein
MSGDHEPVVGNLGRSWEREVEERRGVGMEGKWVGSDECALEWLGSPRWLGCAPEEAGMGESWVSFDPVPACLE